MLKSSKKHQTSSNIATSRGRGGYNNLPLLKNDSLPGKSQFYPNKYKQTSSHSILKVPTHLKYFPTNENSQKHMDLRD